MEEILATIPENLQAFIVVTLLSLLIGLEQRNLHKNAEQEEEEKPVFGTDRTFAFIGILGYVLYILEPQAMTLFLIGGAVTGVLLAIFYFVKARFYEQFGLTSVMIAFITYCLGPLIVTQAPWLVILIFVSVILLAQLKPTFTTLSKRFQREEFTTLAKFLILTGVILPIVPDKQISDFIPTTPYEVWLAVVIISGISYFSYLLQKYVFQNAGIQATGILGGLYSSTATTLILARKSRKTQDGNRIYAASIIYSSAMMYCRIFIIALIFNRELASNLLTPFFFLLILACGIGYWIQRQNNRKPKEKKESLEENPTNPLELKMAIFFAGLFLLFSILTNYALEFYGTTGLNTLSFIVGITDVTPFLINLFEGNYTIEVHLIAKATLFAIASNNLLKAFYAGFFGNKTTMRYSAPALIAIFVFTLASVLLI